MLNNKNSDFKQTSEFFVQSDRDLKLVADAQFHGNKVTFSDASSRKWAETAPVFQKPALPFGLPHLL